MNKKIKMIGLLNMIANGELKNNTKFNIINEDGDITKCKYSSTYPGYIWVIYNDEVSFNYKIDHLRILGYEVEILEDNIEEIEEIKEISDEYFNMLSDETKVKWLKSYIKEDRNKINELINIVKKLTGNLP